jgi:hypothetical protein
VILQPVTETRDYRLPCGHEGRRVSPARGVHPLKRCSVCRTTFEVEVTVPPSGRTDRVVVIIREPQGVPT